MKKIEKNVLLRFSATTAARQKDIKSLILDLCSRPRERPTSHAKQSKTVSRIWKKDEKL
jgi:hypothetical protein